MKPKREYTWVAGIGSVIIAMIIGGTYPYVVLKLGYGNDVSTISALLGAIFLNIVARKTRGANALQNNIIQTVSGSATATAFMCVVLAAFDYLKKYWSMDVGFNPDPWQITAWLTCSGTIGVLLVARYRRFFLDHPKMKFAGGVAAAEVINLLDTEDPTLRKRKLMLGLATAIGVVIAALREVFGWITTIWFKKSLAVGFMFDALSYGVGMILSLNVGLSGLLGAFIVWQFGPIVVENTGLEIVRNSMAPERMVECMAYVGQTLSDANKPFVEANCGLLSDYMRESYFSIAMLWFMWPATVMMITGSITSLLMNMKHTTRSVSASDTKLAADLHRPRTGRQEEDIRLSTVTIGVTVLTIVLAFLQHHNFGVSPAETMAAVVMMVLIIGAGVWVLGETNNGPVSLMANMVQMLFGLIWPHNVKGNLVAAGMSGDGNSQGETVMQTYATGRLVGSTPRILTIAQIKGVLIGAMSASFMYPLLVKTYGLGGEHGLSAPTGLKLANVAVFMDRGLTALPSGAITATIIGAVIGVLFEILRNLQKTDANGMSHDRFPWVPSTAALGFGLILRPTVNIAIAVGAIISWIWRNANRDNFEKYMIPVAAGLVLGEATIGSFVGPFLKHFFGISAN